MIKMDKDVLLCPCCKSSYLHHQSVRSIFRDQEDKDGTDVYVKKNLIMQKRIKSNYIEGRRDIVYIRFFCESCDREDTLTIMQHKGQTLLMWGWPEPGVFEENPWQVEINLLK